MANKFASKHKEYLERMAARRQYAVQLRAQGLTQAAIAAKLGVTRQRIHAMLRDMGA
jgi:transcriptional regulator